MPRKTLQEQIVEDESWFQAQASMVPWEQGQEKLERIFDEILDKNREELFEKPIDRQHADRSTYSLRLRHCLKYHWEKAQQTVPRCIASKVVKAIYQKYKTRNVFDDVVLAVAVVYKEWKSWGVFRPLYNKTFDSVVHTTLSTHYEGKKVNHDDCREKVYGEMAGLEPDQSGRAKNARLNDFAGKGNFIRWLRKAIYRRIASYYRIKHDPMTPDLPSQEKAYVDIAVIHDEVAKLHRVMDQYLTPHERNMFEDHYIHDMTLDEICEKNKGLKKTPTDKGNLSKKLKEIREKIKIRWGND